MKPREKFGAGNTNFNKNIIQVKFKFSKQRIIKYRNWNFRNGSFYSGMGIEYRMEPGTSLMGLGFKGMGI